MTSTTASAARPRRSTGPADRIRTTARAAWRGRETDAAWVRPAYLGLLLGTAVLYLWNLAASGWANAFYSAAVQAATEDWTAFLYGSSDAGNSITVDKPPASIWVMAISARLFGLSPMSMLLPQALMGVLTVALVFAIVRRHFPAPAALLAGAVMALTPVAALMFMFNNPDALLVLLTTAALYCGVRSVEDGRMRWALLAGVAIGFAFLTKQLQAFLVIPALAAVVLLASPRRIGTRVVQLLAAFGALLVSAGWWVAIVELVPASMRPYIGGSQTNSFLELTFGYNGLGRLTGDEVGSVTGGGGNGGGMWGETGILRLFTSDFGGQIAWLLPAALVLAVVSLVVLRRQPRTDAGRATVLLLLGALLVTGLAFSFGAGIIHAYYTVALAPMIAGLVGIGAWQLWAHRGAVWARLVGAALVLGTGWWAVALLDQAPEFLPWLKVVAGLAAVVAAVALAIGPRIRVLGSVALTAALVAGLAGPAAYAVQTTTVPHTGSLPSAGPATTGGMGGPGGAGGRMQVGPGRQGGPQGAPPQGFGGRDGFGPQDGTTPGGTAQGTTSGGTAPGGTAPGATAQGGTRTGGGAGGLLGGSTEVDAAVVEALAANADDYTWVAAAVGSQNAATYQLNTGEAVMPVGGFNGSDPSPTLAQFQQYVADGEIHWFIASSMRGGSSNGGSNASAEIAAWVEANFAATTIGGVTMYDLSNGATDA